jgi:hypothetical protein
MTYRQEMNRLATTMRALLEEGGTVPAGDLRVALPAHAALTDLLTQVETDLALTHRSLAQLRLALRRQPRNLEVPTYGNELGSSTAPDPRTPAIPTSSRAGQLWQDAARSATAAQHNWQHAIPGTRPTGLAARGELADIAALAEATAVLNRDLADSLLAAGRSQDAAEYHRAGMDLLAAARTVRAAITDQVLPPTIELQPHLTAGLSLLRRTPPSLPESLHRLTGLLADTATISAAHLDLITRALAQTADWAATTLERQAITPASTSVLREHASRLAAIIGQGRRIAAKAPSNDLRALTQAQDIHAAVTEQRRRGIKLNATDARASVHVIPEVTLELARTAERQVATGHWEIRVYQKRRASWTSAQATDQRPAQLQEPAMLRRLRQAAEHAPALARDATQNWRTPRTTAPRPPRALLPGSLAQNRPPAPPNRGAHPAPRAR